MFKKKKRHHQVLPAFGLSMGYTLVYLSLIVLIPIAFLFIKAAAISWDDFWSIITDRRVLASFQLTFSTSFMAAFINAIFGTLIAWILAKYQFTGKKIVDAIVDLPFALPTAVAGIALTTLYAPNGWIGRFFEALGIKVAFTPLGIMIALIFIGLPFVVRSVQPVLQELDQQYEESCFNPWSQFFANIHENYFTNHFSSYFDRLFVSFRPRIGRIWFGRLYIRKYAVEDRNCTFINCH